MGDLGPSFANVRTFLTADGLWLRAIERAIESLPEVGGNRCGTVYFPPGLYPIHIDTERGRDFLTIPATVTLELARGAVLGPTARALPGALRIPLILEIRGAIQAGPWRIFTTDATVSSGVGRVLLTGEAVKEVLPEWWGARSSDGPTSTQARVDTAAWKAMIEVACRERIQGVPARPPIPIRLSGLYLLDDTIHLPGAVRAEAPAAVAADVPSVVIRGNGAVLRAVPGFRGSVLLRVTDAMRLDLSGVTLDGDHVNDPGTHRAVWTVLELQPPARRGEEVVPRMQVSVRDCALSGGMRTLVRVERLGTLFPQPPEGDPLALPGVLGAAGLLDLFRALVPGAILLDAESPFDLTFARCVFRVGSPDAGARAVTIASTRARSVQFTGCRFEGGAAAMLHLYGGPCAVTGCRFDNNRPPTSIRQPEGAGGPRGGVDVFLEQVQGRPPPSFAGIATDTVLVGVTHRNRHWSAGSGAPLPPSVEWYRPGATTSLAMVGVALRRPDGALGDANLQLAGRVLVGRDARWVVDLSTRLDDGEESPFVTEDEGMERTGVLRNLLGRTLRGLRRTSARSAAVRSPARPLR